MSAVGYKSSSENTVGKGEIARNEQFLLFQLCFSLFWRSVCRGQMALDGVSLTELIKDKRSVQSKIRLDVYKKKNQFSNSVNNEGKGNQNE